VGEDNVVDFCFSKKTAGIISFQGLTVREGFLLFPNAI
jgi:hypothetical protein